MPTRDCAYLADLLLCELSLFRELPQLAHVRDEQLGDMLARERVSCLRLERISERGDDVRRALLRRCVWQQWL